MNNKFKNSIKRFVPKQKIKIENEKEIEGEIEKKENNEKENIIKDFVQRKKEELDESSLQITRITEDNTSFLYDKNIDLDIYIIHLKNDVNRKKNITEQFQGINFANIKIFDAIKHEVGYIGCALSHLSLIKYAKKLNLPFLVVFEDDTVFNYSSKKSLGIILTLLFDNPDKWSIFNGNPTFYNPISIYRNENTLEFKVSDIHPNLIDLNWGQTTNFVVYNQTIYDKVLEYNFDEDLDVYISKNIKQTTCRHYITTQQDGYSYISKRRMEQSKYIKTCNKYLLDRIK